MTEPIQLQSKHSYFARECSLSRNNPLHKIKVTGVNDKNVFYYDLFHGGQYHIARPTFFKDHLFATAGLYLIQDLGDEDYVAPPIPPEIPEVPAKENFGDIVLKVFLKSEGVRFPNIDYNKHECKDATMVRIWNLCLQFAHISPDDPCIRKSRSNGYGIKKKALAKNYCLTRQVAQYLGCKHTDLTLAQIGYYTGKRGHTTILHSRDMIQDLFEKGNKFVTEMIEFVRGELRGKHILM